MSPGYAIVARFEARPGCEQDLRRILLETSVYALRDEPGCRRFEILQGVDGDGRVLANVFMTNELFDDWAAVQAHRDDPRTPGRAAAIRALVLSQTRIEHAVVVEDA